uniref:Uncharacterized protein n=1 Tax=Anopheles culicifacies TaxID=139723 RepID=A0A182MUD3_9DIPT
MELFQRNVTDFFRIAQCRKSAVPARLALQSSSWFGRGKESAEVESARESTPSSDKHRVRVRRRQEGRSKCIFTVQDISGLEHVEERDVGGAGGGRQDGEVVGVGGKRLVVVESATRSRRRCKVASGKRATNQTMLKYLTHKLRTQSINDENHVNEKKDGPVSGLLVVLAVCYTMAAREFAMVNP